MVLLQVGLEVTEEITKEITKLEALAERLFNEGAGIGIVLLKALAVYVVGRLLIALVNKLVRKILKRKNIDFSVGSFICSLINITLTVLLFVSIVGILGIQTASFAALLASIGLAVGMSLSGNLSNFAGGLIILLFKPFKVGDNIETLSVSGTVREIQIFHTILKTSDNREIFIPNGGLSSSITVNLSNRPERRVEWTFSVSYGENYEKVYRIIEDIVTSDPRTLSEPAVPFIAINTVVDSKVNIVTRAWVKSEDYWAMYHETHQKVYEAFNKEQVIISSPSVFIQK